jgi:hypothetical protein
MPAAMIPVICRVFITSPFNETTQKDKFPAETLIVGQTAPNAITTTVDPFKEHFDRTGQIRRRSGPMMAYA